jgi:hypothetical protein
MGSGGPGAHPPQALLAMGAARFFAKPLRAAELAGALLEVLRADPAA